MSQLQQRNNNKSHPNVYTMEQPAGQGEDFPVYYCFNCKVFYDADGLAGTRLRNHIRDKHFFVDSG